MGAVAVESREIGRDRGYPIVEATLYIYCDNCGTFNVKTYIPFIRLFIAALVLAGGVYLALSLQRWALCLLPLALLSMYLPWRDIFLKYKCRKCGSTYFSDFNALHYPSYDKSILDVPDQLTQKRYIDESVLHFQQFT